jgi:hypothetical protein
MSEIRPLASALTVEKKLSGKVNWPLSTLPGLDLLKGIDPLRST